MATLPASALIQRDKETYQIRLTPPSGVITADELRQLADVADKYEVPLLKITSGQRIALIGLNEEDMANAAEEVPFRIGGHYIQACPGTDWCKMGQCDSLGLGQTLNEKIGTLKTAAKIKVGVCGCPIGCSESHIRDIGFIGGKKGWTMVIGGNSGSRPRIADTLAENLTEEEALDLLDRFLTHYNETAKKKQRVARYVEEHGIEAIRETMGV